MTGSVFEQFRRQYGNPSRIGFDFFRVPVDMADRVLSALVKVRIEESGTRADQKLLDDYRLNDEGRNARQGETYSFEERELTDSLTELGLTPGQLRDAHEMGNLMKGYITSTPLPIYKEINGERKPLGEACFYAVREEGRTIVKALPVLKARSTT